MSAVFNVMLWCTDLTTRATTKLRTLALSEKQRLCSVENIGTQEKNAADLTAERKARKMAAKFAIQKAKAHLKELQDARLDNMQNLLQDLQSSKSVSQADAKALATKHQKLRKAHDASHAFRTTQAQMRTRRAPRIVLLSEQPDSAPQKLLTCFQVGLKEVQLHLLCEEPDHEHIVLSNCHEINQDFEELLRELQPLLASGLQVVTKAIHCSSQCVGVEFILPILGNHVWDIQAMDLEECGLRSQQVPQEDGKMETGERALSAESGAVQWLASYLEENEVSIFKTFGLLRVRYKETERRIFPRYRQGSLAWLCSEHHKRGLQAGMLESYPVRVYHNPEYDQQHPVLN